MIVAADWIPYSLPLRRHWQTANGRIDTRNGRLLRLRAADGRTGWGDAAALPEFGINETQAIAFAEETAHLDLAAQSAELPLNTWLSGNPAVQNLAVNANLGALCDTSADTLLECAAAGYTVLKLKVGIAPLSDEIHRLHQLVSALPVGVSLRLDANRAWTIPSAERFLAACNGLPIDSLEEPITQPTAASLKYLQEQVEFPLAIDESTELLDADFLDSPPVHRVVLKPARLGLLGSYEMALRLRSAGCQLIVTSALESACGWLAAAHLAAAVAPHGTHGLATTDWFQRNTGHVPAINRGRLPLPPGNGLGFAPQQATIDLPL